MNPDHSDREPRRFSLARDERLVLLAVVLAFAPLESAVAADEMFLKLDQVDGESSDARHRGEIELLSFTGSGKAAPPRATTANVDATARCPTVTLTKYVDRASLHMYKRMVTGW